MESNEGKQQINSPVYNRLCYPRNVPIVVSGVLISAFIASILSEFVLVSHRGIIIVSAGRVLIANTPFGAPGLHWLVYSGKLQDRVRVTLTAGPDYQSDQQGRKSLYIPLGWPLLISIGLAAFANRDVFYRPRLGQCSSCGYDVRGVKTCPECGTTVRTLVITKDFPWFAPLVKGIMFLLACAVVTVLIITMWSSIAYDAKNLTVFLSEFTVGLIWPEDGSRRWENEGLRINSFGSTSVSQMLGISWPAIYLNQAEMTRVVRLPIWFCISISGILVLGVKMTKRRVKARKTKIQSMTQEAVALDNDDSH